MPGDECCVRPGLDRLSACAGLVVGILAVSLLLGVLWRPAAGSFTDLTLLRRLGSWAASCAPGRGFLVAEAGLAAAAILCAVGLVDLGDVGAVVFVGSDGGACRRDDLLECIGQAVKGEAAARVGTAGGSDYHVEADRALRGGVSEAGGQVVAFQALDQDLEALGPWLVRVLFADRCEGGFLEGFLICELDLVCLKFRSHAGNHLIEGQGRKWDDLTVVEICGPALKHCRERPVVVGRGDSCAAAGVLEDGEFTVKDLVRVAAVFHLLVVDLGEVSVGLAHRDADADRLRRRGHVVELRMDRWTGLGGREISPVLWLFGGLVG